MRHRHAIADDDWARIEDLLPGQEADVTQGEALIEGHDAEAVIADKGYDSDPLVRRIEGQGAKAVIPPKKNRKVPRPYDKNLYKERNKVERLIRLLKQYRRVAARLAKTVPDFLGFVFFAPALTLLGEPSLRHPPRSSPHALPSATPLSYSGRSP